FLYGFGGTWKTFIWRVMLTALRSKGDIVLTGASSGIAALFIPGGRTTDSRFCIPLNVDEFSAKLIIWDEAPMMHKHCFEVVDRTLKDIFNSVEEKNKHIPFGGKVVVFGGDFRQILPVIPKGIRSEVVHATINSSALWNFCEVLTLNGQTVDDVHTPEFLNTISTSGLPNHKLGLKVRVPVMLLRNLNKKLGLCNGTRLIITRLRKCALEEKIIPGSNIGDQVFIPRFSLTPSDVRIPFKFQRRQFPIMISFAMTINKSRGQSLKHVG
ncbi:uncharacterized protein LOC123924482, partial [Trifolium pratense]|uniref:uncharacterized protein LOC123924482 n=1 Tax=Trifolium pratense TaxID=57577 RepID=UPI001E694BDC